MKIAQVSPIIESVPPKKYGGTERVVHILSEELVARGHKVTLFASGDSQTSANLVSVYPRALRDAKLRDLYGMNVYTMFNIGLAYARQDEFDIIHDHNGHISLPTANIARVPVVITGHGPFTFEQRKIFEVLNKPHIVTISKSQARPAPNVNHIGTVYNGLYMDDYPFSLTNDGYLLFVGRISMEKGVHHAINVAQYLNLPLIIAAKLEKIDMPYFEEYIGPRLSENIKWIGEVNQEERNRLYSRALCSLHPITWDEPFGLTLIEANACGCPVVAFNRGSIAEIIQHGQTGFVVRSEMEMIDAVETIDEIDRVACRRFVLDNFSAQKMADGYEAIYERLLPDRTKKTWRIGEKTKLSISSSPPKNTRGT